MRCEKTQNCSAFGAYIEDNPVRAGLVLTQLPHSERLPSAVLSFLLMQVFCFQSRDADEIEDSA